MRGRAYRYCANERGARARVDRSVRTPVCNVNLNRPSGTVTIVRCTVGLFPRYEPLTGSEQSKRRHRRHFELKRPTDASFRDLYSQPFQGIFNAAYSPYNLEFLLPESFERSSRLWSELPNNPPHGETLQMLLGRRVTTCSFILWRQYGLWVITKLEELASPSFLSGE